MNPARALPWLALPPALALALTQGLLPVLAGALLATVLSAYTYLTTRSIPATALTAALVLPLSFDPLALAAAGFLFLLATAPTLLPPLPAHPAYALLGALGLVLPAPLNILLPTASAALILLGPLRVWIFALALALSPLLVADTLPALATAATVLALSLGLRTLIQSPANLTTARTLAYAGLAAALVPPVAATGYAVATNLDTFVPAAHLALISLIAGLTVLGAGTGLGLWHRSTLPAGPLLVLALAPMAALAVHGALRGFPPLAGTAAAFLSLWAPVSATGWIAMLHPSKKGSEPGLLSPRGEPKPTSLPGS